METAIALVLCLSGIVSAYASTSAVTGAVSMGRKLLGDSASLSSLSVPSLTGVIKYTVCYDYYSGLYYDCTVRKSKNLWWVYFLVSIVVIVIVLVIVMVVIIRRRRFHKSMEAMPAPPATYPYNYAGPPGSSAGTAPPVHAPPPQYGDPSPYK